jgi:hypothetical protein
MSKKNIYYAVADDHEIFKGIIAALADTSELNGF